HFDLLRYWTGMDVVQVKADTFIPNYSWWQGSSTVFCNLALAHKDDWHHRSNWTWVQYYGDWQARGPSRNFTDFYFDKGQMTQGGGWLEIKKYKDEVGRQWEEEGFLGVDCGGDGVEHLNTPYEGQGIILEQIKRSIDSGGKNQSLNNFKDIFKSFAISMGAIESSKTGKTVWVPKYWEDMPELN
ncbi:MAG: hypothetical protein ACFFCS_03030, partial [Candidatus Hodarchaeota archaeon]